MPAVQSISRLEQVIAQAVGQTMGAAVTTPASFTWQDQQGNALTYAFPSGVRPFEWSLYVRGRIQPMQGWRLNLTGNNTIYYAHGYTPTATENEGALTGGGLPLELLEGRSLFESLQFVASGANTPFTLEILG